MSEQNIYDTIIIGAGPGGCAAAIYAARKKLKTLLITESFGGQSAISATIENWIGDIKLSGHEFAKKLENHVRAQNGLEIHSPERLEKIIKNQEKFILATDKSNYQSKTVILAMGGKHRHLNVLGEEKFDGRGVAYCSTCDAPIFKNKDVVVVGSGNSGLEAVLDLAPYARKIYLMDFLKTMKGDSILQDEIKKLGSQVEFIAESKIIEIYGETMVTGIKYEQKGESKELITQGVFVEIGTTSNSDIVKDLVELDNFKQVVVDPTTQQTSMPGMFAVGDLTNNSFKQNNISARDGVIAALSAEKFLIKK